MTPGAADLLVDGFGRVREVVDAATAGLTLDQLTWRADAEANTVAWLVWHLTRIEDDHLAAAFGTDQVWTSVGWAERFDLPFADTATGYGQSSADVAAVRVDSTVLTGYHHAVHEQAVALVRGVDADDLGRVVDDSWDPPVTLGVRLVSVLSDALQHAGQAAFVRGLLDRR
ncbi:MAG: DinB family protein [Actinomycetota bacterium]|nr:DinB family protein [Actinomycetota bacterium]